MRFPWNLAPSGGIEDARKGCRHEHERESCGNNAEITHGIVGSVFLQLIKTGNESGEGKQDKAQATEIIQVRNPTESTAAMASLPMWSPHVMSVRL